MIVDSHNHLGRRRTDDDETPFAGVDLDDFLAMMDGSGIDHAVVFPLYDRYGDYNPLNEEVRQAFTSHPTRLTGLFRVDPYLEHQTLDDVERALAEESFRGLKIHPRSDRTFIDESDRLDPLVEIAAAHDWPILIHTGDDPPCRPYMLFDLLRRHPGARFIMGHSGQRAYHEGLWVAEHCPNVYMETSTLAHPQVIQLILDTVGAERVLFGTDVPFGHPRVELVKYEVLELEPGVRNMVMAENAIRLWRLDSLSGS
ncbi:MAG: amidohydrolase family protein [Bacillota bacterium]